MQARESFIIHMDDMEQLDDLTDKEKGQLFSALVLFTSGAEAPKLPRLLNSIFKMLASRIERDWERYDDISKVRSESGQKGGAPKGNTNAKKQPEPDENNQNKQNNQIQAKTNKTSYRNPDRNPVPDPKRDPDRNIENEDGDRASAPPTRAPAKMKYSDFVEMTGEEYGKLTDAYGEDAVRGYIEDLNNYKGSTGKKYKSDYLTLLTWIKRDKNTKPSANAPPVRPAAPDYSDPARYAGLTMEPMEELTG